jgi:16S rRNA C1402 N4-methylase RsmH
MSLFLNASKIFLKSSANNKGIYIDFTMGRGRDTVFLCQLAPLGRVYAFDIQEDAVSQTKELLKASGIENATLILDSHHRFGLYIDEPIDGGIFNLGFLPGSDRAIKTSPDITIAALSRALTALKPGGRISVTVYPGHEEGEMEGRKLLTFSESLDKAKFSALVFRMQNVAESPFNLLFEKQKR